MRASSCEYLMGSSVCHVNQNILLATGHTENTENTDRILT